MINELTNFKSLQISEKFSDPNEFGFSLLHPYALYQHQINCINWQLEKEDEKHLNMKGGIHGLVMGLGKTLIALSMCKVRSGRYPDLFICNLSIINEIVKQINQFFGNSLKFKIIHNDFLTKKEKLDNFKEEFIRGFDIIIMTYDSISGFGKRVGLSSKNKPSQKRQQAGNNFFNIKWNRIILDESQHIRNFKSNCTKSILHLKSDFKMCLTGTPVINFDHDLKSQLVFCGLNELIRSNSNTYKQLNVYNNIMCMTFQQAGVQLPERIDIPVTFDFSNEEEFNYSQQLEVCKKMFAKRDRKECKHFTVTAELLKLRHICNSINDIEPKNDQDWLEIAQTSTKIHGVMAILRKVEKGNKVVIFSPFNRFLNLLQHALQSIDCGNIYNYNGCLSQKRRTAIINEFNDTKSNAKILLLSNQLGKGLNLAVANVAIMTSPDTNQMNQNQCIARIYRMGQVKKVYVYHLITKNTVEEKLANRKLKSGLIIDQNIIDLLI
jgi:SNF2 family DNA or RNA helicase